MAKTHLPLMSLSASGSVAQQLQYQRPGVHGTARRITRATLSAASASATSAQQQQRARYRHVLNGWMNLSTPQKNVWNEDAKRLDISGMNLYLRTFLREWSRLAADNFDRANGPLGANWTHAFNEHLIDGHSVTGSNNLDSLSYWSAEAPFSANQFSEVVLEPNVDEDHLVGLAVRASGAAGTSAAYVIQFLVSNTAQTLFFNAWVAGVWNAISTHSVLTAPGDTVRFEASGQSPVTLAVLVNGAAVTDRQDSTFLLTSGRPGLQFWSTARATEWSGGNLPA